MIVDEEIKKFPNIYYTPKLHKYLSKARLIIVAHQCSVKPLPKAVTSVFKLMYKQIGNSNFEMRYFSRFKSFWQVQNRQITFDAIKKLNFRKKALSTGADAGGFYCCQCSTPKRLTSFSRVEFLFPKMMRGRF